MKATWPWLEQCWPPLKIEVATTYQGRGGNLIFGLSGIWRVATYTPPCVLVDIAWLLRIQITKVNFSFFSCWIWKKKMDFYLFGNVAGSFTCIEIVSKIVYIYQILKLLEGSWPRYFTQYMANDKTSTTMDRMTFDASSPDKTNNII